MATHCHGSPLIPMARLEPTTIGSRGGSMESPQLLLNPRAANTFGMRITCLFSFVSVQSSRHKIAPEPRIVSHHKHMIKSLEREKLLIKKRSKWSIFFFFWKSYRFRNRIICILKEMNSINKCLTIQYVPNIDITLP